MVNERFDTMLRLPQVKQISGLGRSSIYSGMKKGTFPKQCKLGDRAVGWSSAAVFLWVAERKSAE